MMTTNHANLTRYEPEVGPVHVLLVDDNEIDRRTIRRLFERLHVENCDLSEAASISDAQRMFGEKRPDCVLIVDYHLPGKNGLDLLKSLPSEADGAPPEAILITVDDDPKILVSAMRQGIRDFVHKDTLNATTLSQAIRRVAERRQLRLQLVQQRQQLETQNAELRASQKALLNIMEDLEREVAQRKSGNGKAEDH